MQLVWFGESSCSEAALVGGKTANLSKLASTYRVPPGFCVTTHACATAREPGVEAHAEERMNPSLYDALAQAYEALGQRVGDTALTVAVRSSAADEDGVDNSFAGQHETFLNISGVDEVAAAVQRCWASARSPRALEYRRLNGLPEDGVRLGVLVQQLVAADVSAVVFSANPVTGCRDEVVINASWGLGESIVGGSVSPDTYRVRKSDLTLLTRQIGDKRRMTVPVPGGTREVEVPRLLAREPVLTGEQCAEVAALAQSLEQTMGWPVDVECAYRAGTLYLLQCRPITTLHEPAASRNSDVA